MPLSRSPTVFLAFALLLRSRYAVCPTLDDGGNARHFRGYFTGPVLVKLAFNRVCLTRDTCILSCRATMQTPFGPRDSLCSSDAADRYILASHDDEHSLYASFTGDLQDTWEVEDEG